MPTTYRLLNPGSGARMMALDRRLLRAAKSDPNAPGYSHIAPRLLKIPSAVLITKAYGDYNTAMTFKLTSLLHLLDVLAHNNQRIAVTMIQVKGEKSTVNLDEYATCTLNQSQLQSCMLFASCLRAGGALAVLGQKVSAAKVDYQ
jgi:hypothetical protein